MPDSARIQTLVHQGVGDISGPFALDGPFGLVFLRADFTSGTGSADMTLSVKSAITSDFDRVLHTFYAVGTGGDAYVNFRIPDDEFGDWLFGYSRASELDKLDLAWTNPDSGTMKWTMQLGLKPLGTMLW